MANQNIVSIHGETYRIIKRKDGRLYLVKVQVSPRSASDRLPGHLSPGGEMREKEADRKISAAFLNGPFDRPGLDATLIEKVHALEEENERLDRLVRMQRRLIRSNHNPDCSITLKLEA